MRMEIHGADNQVDNNAVPIPVNDQFDEYYIPDIQIGMNSNTVLIEELM